ncbi:hypothetical protein HF998_02215 [Cellulomonas hominis]|nr:hypothetical protein [Cellulomonas hominis]
MRLERAVLNIDELQLEWDGIPSSTTEELDAAHETAIVAWAADLKARGRDAAGPPPKMPGDRLARLHANVIDDLGREWTLVAGQTAGTGSEWHSVWRYQRPGRGGEHLTVRFSVDDDPTAEVEISLT